MDKRLPNCLSNLTVLELNDLQLPKAAHALEGSGQWGVDCCLALINGQALQGGQDSKGSDAVVDGCCGAQAQALEVAEALCYAAHESIVICMPAKPVTLSACACVV